MLSIYIFVKLSEGEGFTHSEVSRPSFRATSPRAPLWTLRILSCRPVNKKEKKKKEKKDIRSWRLRSRLNQKFTSVFQPWDKFRDEFITRNKIIRIIDRLSDHTDRLTFHEDFLKFVNLSTPFDCLLIIFFFTINSFQNLIFF